MVVVMRKLPQQLVSDVAAVCGRVSKPDQRKSPLHENV